MLPKAHFATVYAKPQGRPVVDTFVTEVSQDTWIYFPWDMGYSFQPPIKGERGGLAPPSAPVSPFGLRLPPSPCMLILGSVSIDFHLASGGEDGQTCRSP